MKMSERNKLLLTFQDDIKTMVGCYLEASEEAGIKFTKEEITNALHHVQLNLTND